MKIPFIFFANSQQGECIFNLIVAVLYEIMLLSWIQNLVDQIPLVPGYGSKFC